MADTDSDVKQLAGDHDDDSGCGDDSASSYASSSSNNGTTAELTDTTSAIGATHAPTTNSGKYRLATTARFFNVVCPRHGSAIGWAIMQLARVQLNLVANF